MKITCRSHAPFAALLLGMLLAFQFKASAAELPSALATEPKGWADVMPPADLRGWTRVAIPPTNALGRAQWHLDVARRLLVCDGDGGHEMLRFDRKLTNAIFHVEFRFAPLSEKHPHYNSGIFIRNSVDGTIWHQCQLTSDGGYLFGDTPVNGKPKSFLSPAENRCWKSAVDWNTVEITARGSTLSVWFNGAALSELANCQMPAGYIALESEGYAIEFRNLKLKELP
jgi:3-keto-disaccharide hydrolase